MFRATGVVQELLEARDMCGRREFMETEDANLLVVVEVRGVMCFPGRPEHKRQGFCKGFEYRMQTVFLFERLGWRSGNMEESQNGARKPRSSPDVT